MDESTAIGGGQRRAWAFDGALDGYRFEYIERDLGGLLAAVMRARDGVVVVVFDPRVLKPTARHLLRSWARYRIVNGVGVALATGAEIAPFLG